MKISRPNCKLKVDSVPVAIPRILREEPVEFNTGQI